MTEREEIVHEIRMVKSIDYRIQEMLSYCYGGTDNSTDADERFYNFSKFLDERFELRWYLNCRTKSDMEKLARRLFIDESKYNRSGVRYESNLIENIIKATIPFVIWIIILCSICL